jgi:hypothetical protein
MKFHRSFQSLFGLVAILAISLAGATAYAGTFSWGDYVGDDVMYLDVTENNEEATALFAPMPGVGGPIVSGNSLHLDPQNFSAQGTELIDSTLSTVIMAAPGQGITDINIAELGDYSLGGLLGGQASAEVGAAFFWTVLEIDNAAVNLATQATNLILGTGSGPNGGRYDRPGDDGTAIIWNGAANIDLSGYLDSIDLGGKVTKVRLTFDNTLQTSADDVSNAFIKKKSIDIDVHTENCIPEPTAAMLLSVGVVLLPRRRR